MSVGRILSLLWVIILLEMSHRSVGGRRGEQPKFARILHLLKPWMNPPSTKYDRCIKREAADDA